MKKRMKSIKSYFIPIFTVFAKPATTALALLTMIAAYFSPIYVVGLCILGFVFVDFITGIVAARKRKEKISSHTMKNSVIKLLCYYATLILAFVLQKEIITFDWFTAVKFTGALICIAEFKSILENMFCITGNNVFTDIFTKLSDLFKKKTDGL
jgi:hypothetical protein